MNEKNKMLEMMEKRCETINMISEEIYKTVKPAVRKEKQLGLRKFFNPFARITYGQQWSEYNMAQMSEKLLFLHILLELCSIIPEPKLKRKGRIGLPLKERLFCLGLYTYGCFSSRRTISDLKIAKSLGLVRAVPHFNTLLSYLANPELTTVITNLIIMSSLPLKNIESRFAIDSTGFSTPRYEQWFNIRTQKKTKKRGWKKAHCMVGTKTNVITSIIITDGENADSPYLKPLVEGTRRYFDMAEVSADKAYISRANLETISAVGAMPFIPFKSNTSGKARGSHVWSKMYRFFKEKAEEFGEHYHIRSNIEATYSMVKRKFSNHLKSKRTTAQINEILMKFLCLNICILIEESFERGIEIDLNSCAEMFNAQN